MLSQASARQEKVIFDFQTLLEIGLFLYFPLHIDPSRAIKCKSFFAVELVGACQSSLFFSVLLSSVQLLQEVREQLELCPTTRAATGWSKATVTNKFSQTNLKYLKYAKNPLTQWFSIVLSQGGSFVGSPFGAITHFRLQIQFSIVLPQGGSFVGSPFGAIPHFRLQIQFSMVLPQLVWCGLSPEFLFQQDTTCLHECK